MFKYMMSTLIVTAVFLLNGCSPDLETEMRKQERAKIEVDIAAMKLDVAKAQRDAKISEMKLLSEEREKYIKFKSELNEIEQQAVLGDARTVANLRKLASENGIYLPWKPKDADIKNANYKAADSLLRHLSKLKKPEVKLSKDAPILVASFVDLDDLSKSSTFGRVVSEQIASRFNQKHYATIELKLGSNVFIKEGLGEIVLSREMKKIGIKHRAQAVIVGTYSVASTKIYLTVRVINVSDGRVLASHDYEVPIDLDILKMLLNSKDKSY